MARLNVLLTGYEITDEVIERSSSTALALGHDTIRGITDLEIWTGAGGTGTQLALTTDYTVSDEDTDLSTEAEVTIYTKLAIVNGTYHDTTLYVTYKTIGDYASAETVRSFDAEYTEVTGNYTVLATDRYLRITTASAITITIPDTMPDNWPLTFSRPVSSANAVTAARSGTELIEGATSFVVIGAKAAAEYDPSEVTLRKVGSGDWRFVVGCITGRNSYGMYEKFSNGLLLMHIQSHPVGPNANVMTTMPHETSSTNYTVTTELIDEDTILSGGYYMDVKSKTTTTFLIYRSDSVVRNHNTFIDARWR